MIWRVLGVASLLGLVAIGVQGCSNSSKTTQDMTMAPDQSVPSGKNCLGIITCVKGLADPTNAADVMNCYNQGTASAQAAFQALQGCGIEACTVVIDGGANADGGGPACSGTSDTSPTCAACAEGEALAPACSTQLAACESN